MRFRAILNRQGGTLRTTDLNAFSARMRETLEAARHSMDIRIVDGKELVAALREAAAADDVDAIIAGGGDGTASAAAGCLMNTDKILAILPAGTMNLFARSLAIPLDLDTAVQSFASGKVHLVDVATANGQPFVHQFSVGMHAKMVKLREKMDFDSRIGKIRASARAALDTIMNPPSMVVDLDMGATSMTVHTSGIGVSNNLFGEGHLPYADDPTGGILGIYVARALRRRDVIWLSLSILIGRWGSNPQVEIHQSDSVVMRFSHVHPRHRCVIDGELCKLESSVTIQIHPKCLRVLVPATS
ncbi:MAG: diacylglycerol kinase family lipid kinase [Mesorhizobium sp.]|nr:diacylglycerol kinase family lipid kinase [Mesorhizobium sp.]